MTLYIYLHQPKPFQKRRVRLKTQFSEIRPPANRIIWNFFWQWLVPCHDSLAVSTHFPSSTTHQTIISWRCDGAPWWTLSWFTGAGRTCGTCQIVGSTHRATLPKKWTKAVVRNVGEQRTLHKGNCKLLSGSNHQLHLVLFAPYFVSDWWKRNMYKHAYIYTVKWKITHGEWKETLWN